MQETSHTLEGNLHGVELHLCTYLYHYGVNIASIYVPRVTRL